MAERIPIPATAANVEWNTNPTNPSTDPSLQRAAGWAVNEIPDAQEFNYLQTMWGDFLVWLRSFAPREWTDIWEALADVTDVSQLFYVYPPAAGMHARGLGMWAVAGTGSGTGVVSQPCTDGEQIYHLDGAYIVAVDPADGTQIWEVDPEGIPLTAITTDGSAVYVTTNNVGYPGLYEIGRTAGSTVDTAGTEYACGQLVANGEYCVGTNPASGGGKVVTWSGLGTALVQDGVYDTGSAALPNVAIDSTQCYVGGTRNTYDVWAVAMAAPTTYVWRITLPVTTAPTVYGIAADGDCVYVGTEQKTLSAGGTANIFCLDRTTGAVLWTMDLPGDQDFGVAVDDRYLYSVNDSGVMSIVRLRSSVPSVVHSLSVFAQPQCDGVSVIGTGATSSQLRRVWVLGASKLMMRADGNDPNRRPFHNLAIPVDGRI